MAANHVSKAAGCSSNVSGRRSYSLRSARLEDDAELKIQSYENGLIDDYTANRMISEAISDQSSSGKVSNCDQNQMEANSRTLIMDVLNSLHGEQEDQGRDSGEVAKLQELQKITKVSDPRHSDAEASYASDRNPCYDGMGAAFAAYAGDHGGGVNVGFSAIARDSADNIKRGDACTAVAGGDRHSSSGGGICVAMDAGDQGCSRSAKNAKLIDGVRAVVKAGSGYAATAVFAGNAAGDSGADSAGAAGKMRRRKKFVGVRQRPSGRWVAEIKDTTQKIRMWLGTFDTAEEAARAYDEAACLLRGSNTRTNFVPLPPSSPSSSPLASRLAHMLRARQNRNTASELPQPPSRLPAAAAAPLTEPCSSNPLGFASSPINPSISSAYSQNRNPNQTIQRSNDSTKSCPNLKQIVNPHTKHFSQNSFHNPYRKTLGSNRQQHATVSNHGYELRLLRPHTEIQSNPLEFFDTKSSKANSCPLWRSSKCESESSDSDLSPPFADYFMNSIHKHPHTYVPDHVQIPPQYKGRFVNLHGCGNGMASHWGKEISQEILQGHANSANEDMDWDDDKQIFAMDKTLINAEDIDTLTHDQHLMRSIHSYPHNYRGRGFMDALMGINDDIILNPSEHMGSILSSDFNNHTVSPFDFNTEASLGSSMMQVDEFPLISELSGKLEEEEGGLNHYVNLCNDEGSHNSSSSSSNIVNDSAHDNAKSGLHLDANFPCGIDSADLEMKRMRFERRASASLYALTGVHEMALKQTPSPNPGTNYLLAGNSTSTSFNFLSISPSYMLSSPWKQTSAASSTTTSTCDDSSALNAGNASEAVINAGDDSSAMNASGAVMNTPSLSSTSLSSCPSDTKNNSTLAFSNKGSDTSNGISNSSTNNNSLDAQSQEAAMWNSWDLAPLCTLVA